MPPPLYLLKEATLFEEEKLEQGAPLLDADKTDREHAGIA
jgi:hypothetical protein